MLLKDKDGIKKLSTILKNLWSKDLNKIDSLNELFKARLIALNKVHPKTPRPDEFRPIIILSLIVKIMECRWLPKLQEYVITKLSPAQTGFVPGQGVFTNIFRAIKRIKARTDIKQNVFGFFMTLKVHTTTQDMIYCLNAWRKYWEKMKSNFKKPFMTELLFNQKTRTLNPTWESHKEASFLHHYSTYTRNPY